MDAQERSVLVGSIVQKVADYRNGEIAPIQAADVLAWLGQFDAADRPTILRESARYIGSHYISRDIAKRFISGLGNLPLLVGDDAARFWQSTGCLRLQQGSASQNDMLALLDEALQETLGIHTSQQGDGKTYVYLDDLMCTGDRVLTDLSKWIECEDIRNATIHLIFIATHALGEWNVKKNLARTLTARRCSMKTWRAACFENRLKYAVDSQVFWPTELPNDAYVNAWMATLPAGYEFKARPPNGSGSRDLFSSEAARHVIEQSFMKKGAYIRSLPANPKEIVRPLGYSRMVTPGFGSAIITYRNCPNNAPLVLWWGNHLGAPPLNGWRPLFPRRFRAANIGAEFGF